jgi:hypothetical protein
VSGQLGWRIGVCESGIDPTARYVALVLDTFMDKRGFAWPSYRSIASRAGVSARTVERAVARLEHAGLLLVVHSPGRWSNRYQAAWPNSDTGDVVAGQRTATPVTPQPRHGQRATATPVSREAVRKPSEKPKGARAHIEPTRVTPPPEVVEQFAAMGIDLRSMLKPIDNDAGRGPAGRSTP